MKLISSKSVIMKAYYIFFWYRCSL